MTIPSCPGTPTKMHAAKQMKAGTIKKGKKIGQTYYFCSHKFPDGSYCDVKVWPEDAPEIAAPRPITTQVRQFSDAELREETRSDRSWAEAARAAAAPGAQPPQAGTITNLASPAPNQLIRDDGFGGRVWINGPAEVNNVKGQCAEAALQFAGRIYQSVGEGRAGFTEASDNTEARAIALARRVYREILLPAYEGRDL